MEYPTYFVSRLLTIEAMREALNALGSILVEELPAETILTAQYGWGAELHPDLCYRDMRVGIGWLGKFISDSQKSIVVAGDSDFTISTPESTLIIHFCHEGDIHTGGSDVEMQKRLWSRSPFCDFPLVWREGVYLLEPSKHRPSVF